MIPARRGGDLGGSVKANLCFLCGRNSHRSARKTNFQCPDRKHRFALTLPPRSPPRRAGSPILLVASSIRQCVRSPSVSEQNSITSYGIGTKQISTPQTHYCGAGLYYKERQAFAASSKDDVYQVTTERSRPRPETSFVVGIVKRQCRGCMGPAKTRNCVHFMSTTSVDLQKSELIAAAIL